MYFQMVLMCLQYPQETHRNIEYLELGKKSGYLPRSLPAIRTFIANPSKVLPWLVHAQPSFCAP